MSSASKVPLSEVCKVISGYAFKSAAFKTGGNTPVIKIKNIKIGTASLVDAGYVDSQFLDKIDSKFKVCADDILISLTGSHMTQPNSVVGRVGRYPSKYPVALLNQRAGKVIPNEKVVDKTYLFYSLLGNDIRKEIAQMAHGAASQANVSPSQIESIEIPLPNLKTQVEIGNILQNYDKLIENNNRRIAILEDMAQSLYREWFVNFRYPGHADAVDKDANQKLIDSPLGQIPDGWVVKTLKDVVELAYGKALKKPDRKGGSVVVYGSGGFGGYHDKTLVEGPCIIVGRKGNVGKVFWVDQDCWPIDTVFYVKSEFSKFYLYYNLLHQTFFNSDAAVPGLNRESAYCNKIILPSAELVTQFNEFIKPIFKQRYLISKANNNLKLQRDMLLPKLISGQIEL
jgi:type I restriction enzyme S subunit